ncbi:hypothetical protein AB1Y20_022460 [Prymnesium parvum]|uniref:Pre-rRNA-processing protein TSR2 homolog n=1 Tax=Prymnesium parvum TaxID=97485 RepID=A0AB34JJN5_PRYPA
MVDAPRGNAVEETLRQAIRVVFGEWSALVMALENEWGGQASRDKAFALLQKVENGMCTSAQVYADELEDLLDTALVDDFSVEAEDESPKEIAELLAKLHYEARQGVTDTAQLLIARAQAKGSKTWVQGELQVRKAADSSDDEDIDGDDEDEGTHSSAMDTESSGTSRGWAPPIVDEDGFQMVSKGARGRPSRAPANQQS